MLPQIWLCHLGTGAVCCTHSWWSCTEGPQETWMKHFTGKHLTWTSERCTGGSLLLKCRLWPLKPSVLTLGIVLLPTALQWICYQQKHSDYSSLETKREVCNEGLEMLEHAPISPSVRLIVCHQPSHLESSLSLLPVKQKNKRWHNVLPHNTFTYCCSLLVEKIVLSATFGL